LRIWLYRKKILQPLIKLCFIPARDKISLAESLKCLLDLWMVVVAVLLFEYTQSDNEVFQRLVIFTARGEYFANIKKALGCRSVVVAQEE